MNQNNSMASQDRGEIMEQVLMAGNLAQLTPEQRVSYYRQTCTSLGLNELTKPFDYINLSGKLTLYATRTASDQLRKINGVSIEHPSVQFQEDLVLVTVTATDKTGRTDTDVGAVTIGTLKGEARANAIMKAITKAKRRVTLSICGLGWMDETEAETVPTARVAAVDHETGEIYESPSQERAATPEAAAVQTDDPSPSPSPAASPPKEPRAVVADCADCEAQVEDKTVGTQKLTAERIKAGSLKRYQTVLCLDCYRKRESDEKKAQERVKEAAGA